ncbi:hypothetical protein ACFUJ0_26130 [Streptomyces sp. NPDC057242]|uniref:hypothetical protein n=1 Tax=unclassified Streptomyces TaxID=2593676 RepID=UPI0036286A4A
MVTVELLVVLGLFAMVLVRGGNGGAGAQLVTTGRRRYLRLARHWPWTDVITTAFERLRALPQPG